MNNLFVKIFIFIFFLNVYNHLIAEEIHKDSTCKWDNKNGIPCFEINSNLANISKFANLNSKKIIITKKYIDNSGAIDLVDLLSKVPGIHVAQSGPTGQQTSLFMRGMGSNHTLVLINGVSIVDQSSTQGLFNFGADFMQTIQQIEIYQGSNGVHFGPNAMAGAINIVTSGDLKDSYSISTVNNENYNLALNKSYITQNNTLLNLKLGNVNHKTKSAKFGGKEIDGTKNLTGNFNSEKWINDKLRLSNTIYLRQTITDYDGSSSDEYGYQNNDKMGTVQLGLTNKKKNTENNLKIYYNKYDREYDEKNISDYYESSAFGVKYDSSKLLMEFLSFGYGSEYRYDDGDFQNNGAYTASTKGHYDTISAYSNLGIRFFDSLNLSTFIRNDINKRTSSNKTYKINLEKQNEDFTFGFARMTGLRHPTIYELYGTDNYGYSGNKNLRSEKSLTNELYFNYSFLENWFFNSTLFKSNISDQISYSNNKYINKKDDVDLNQKGINSSIKYLQKNSSFNLFSTLLTTQKENGNDQLRRPQKMYGINFLKKFGKGTFKEINLNIDYLHYGKHLDTHSSNFSTIEMDSTDIMNLSLSKNFKGFNIFINSTNILNEKFQRPHGYSQEERRFSVGMKSNY